MILLLNHGEGEVMTSAWTAVDGVNGVELHYVRSSPGVASCTFWVVFNGMSMDHFKSCLRTGGQVVDLRPWTRR